jgi:hypothetical protein
VVEAIETLGRRTYWDGRDGSGVMADWRNRGAFRGVSNSTDLIALHDHAGYDAIQSIESQDNHCKKKPNEAKLSHIQILCLSRLRCK